MKSDRELFINQLSEYIWDNVQKNEDKYISFISLREDQKNSIFRIVESNIRSTEAEICDLFFIDTYFTKE